MTVAGQNRPLAGLVERWRGEGRLIGGDTPAIDLSGIDSMKALLWAAIVNGVVSVPIMVIMMVLAGDPARMGPFVVKRRLKFLGWLATAVMTAAVGAMFVLM